MEIPPFDILIHSGNHTKVWETPPPRSGKSV
jgi:hypothetical protein